MKKPTENIRVCFLADKHGLYDDRIYWKMALSLLNRGYEIYYLFIGEKEERGTTKEGVHYIGLKVKRYSNNRYLNYLVKYSRSKTNYDRLFEKAKELHADVYHFHDLNINKIGNKLKQLEQRPVVIYDARDPFAQNIRDYIGSESSLRPLVHLFANYTDRWEKKCSKRYDFVICNEENLQAEFTKVLPPDRVGVIYNYTKLHNHRKEVEKIYDLIYCGGITKFRGAFKIIEAVRLLKETMPEIKMIFLGNFFTKGFKDKMKERIASHKLEENIILKDSVPYTEVADYYNRSKIGLGIFLPIKTHEIILQIKIFEYMAMGLPIVGSNFGHINNYIKKDEVGLVVDATNPNEIAAAAQRILKDEQLYNRFRENGIRNVVEKYHWEIMEQKLFKIYDELLLNRKSRLNEQ